MDTLSEAERIELLKPVARVVNLIHVQQTSYAARLHVAEVPPRIVKPFRMNTNVKVAYNAQTESHIIIDVDYSLMMLTSDSKEHEEADSAEEFASLESHFVLVYACPNPNQFNKEQLSAFAEINGPHNLWPFVREFVQSALLRLGITGVTVPTLQRLRATESSSKTVRKADAPSPSPNGISGKGSSTRAGKKNSEKLHKGRTSKGSK